MVRAHVCGVALRGVFDRFFQKFVLPNVFFIWLSSLISHLQLISFEEAPITLYIAVAPGYFSRHF